MRSQNRTSSTGQTSTPPRPSDGSVLASVLRSPTATTITVPVRTPNEVKVLPANGTNTSGAGTTIFNRLRQAQYDVLAASNTTSLSSTSNVYYNPGFDREARVVAQQAHAAGVYLIGRVVVFEDPTLTAARPDMAIRTTGGSVWVNNAGLGWSNPYDKRVWNYVISVGKAAARAGFDEIQFDYVRFPSDGPIENAVFPHKTAEPV